METTYTIIRADGTEEQRTADLPKEPGYESLAAIVEPILDGAWLERVNVLHEGAYTDMFVDEEGALAGLPENAKASVIYNNNLRTYNPALLALQGEGKIFGTAVLFSRRVWF